MGGWCWELHVSASGFGVHRWVKVEASGVLAITGLTNATGFGVLWDAFGTKIALSP